MELWWIVLSAVVAYVVYKLVVFARADGDLVLLSKRLRPEYFAGKVVWVTGASSGIGEALCYRLSRLGAKLILSARSVEKLQKVKDALADPQNARVLPVDLSDPESTRTAAGRAGELFGKIDILVNNAGISMRAVFLEMEEEVNRRVMEIDFFSPCILTRKVLPGMLSEGFGHIVNVSSTLGKFSSPTRTSYCAAKFAIHGLMDSLRLELIGKNIHITNMCPGPVKTQVSVNAMTKDGSKFGKTDDMIASGMSADRCAELMLIAVSNQLHEVWISKQPYLFMPYLAHYAPSILWVVMKKKAAPQMMNIARQ